MLVNLVIVLFYILIGVVALSGGINVSSAMGMTTFTFMMLFALYEVNKK